MKRSQLIDALAARFEGNRKAAAQALDAVVDTITREVAKGERVAIKGFGTFERVLPKKFAVKKGKIPPRKAFVPSFAPAKQLAGVVSGRVKLPQVPAKAAAVVEAVENEVRETAEEIVEKTPLKRPAARRTPAAKTTPAKRTPAKKTSTAKKTTTAKKTPTTAAPAAAKKTATRKTSTTPRKTTSAAKKTTTRRPAAKKTTPPTEPPAQPPAES